MVAAHALETSLRDTAEQELAKVADADDDSLDGTYKISLGKLLRLIQPG